MTSCREMVTGCTVQKRESEQTEESAAKEPRGLSDHRGLRPADVQVTDNLLRDTLTRWKTGADAARLAFIDPPCHVRSPRWPSRRLDIMGGTGSYNALRSCGQVELR